MNKLFRIIIPLFFLCSHAVAQEIIENQTFKGIDADTTKINKPTLGIQIANDVSFVSYPKGEEFTIGDYNEDMYSDQVDDIKDISATEYFAKQLGWTPMYWQRADLFTSIALQNQTNFYSLISFRVLKMDSGGSADFSYTILNLEVEHYFNKHYKIRFGRLINKLSASQFYGRIALGASDSHVYGRTPFVCDALEFDINYKDKGLPVFMIGVKPQFNSFDFNSFYIGAHSSISKNIQTFLLFSYNKQQYEELSVYVPSVKKDRYYSAFEAEVSYNGKIFTSFINIGTLSNYLGIAPHFSGPRDILKQNEPIITSGNLSLKQTFIPSIGLSVNPCKMTSKLSFFKKIGIEAEINGLFNTELTSLNAFANAKFTILKNFNIEYGLNLNKIKYAENKDFYLSTTPIINNDKFNYGVHYLRLSLIFGQPTRKM